MTSWMSADIEPNEYHNFTARSGTTSRLRLQLSNKRETRKIVFQKSKYEQLIITSVQEEKSLLSTAKADRLSTDGSVPCRLNLECLDSFSMQASMLF
jgi:hypothetical protein